MTVADLGCEVLKSTASAITWAILGWLFLFGRNWHLERSLRKAFGNHSLTMGIPGMGISLKNPTAYEVIVREVHAQQTTSGSIVLNYDGPKNEVDERKSVVLPPFSQGTWLIPRSLYHFQQSEFTAIAVEFLYPSLFGSLKRVTINGNKDLIEHFNKMRKQDEQEMSRLEPLRQQLGK
jgi:hypothetical protein